jgi:CRP-like cAMP-binding protein/ribonuclease BN (tRNA processing enzyme)
VGRAEKEFTVAISDSTFQKTTLPRGGVLLQWDDFVVQLGAYPETIKDTLKGETGVPNLFIQPESMFDIHNGISLAELEFPLYYNYYVKGRKLRFLCRPEQSRPIFRLLKEAVFGPSSFHLEREFPRGAQSYGFPDLKAEGAWYKTVNGQKLKLGDFIEPITCAVNETIEVDDTRITILPGDRYRFERNGEVEEVKFNPLATPKFSHDGGTEFKPPEFGITVLGAGHGFDVNSRTSGFIIWIGSRGLLVDPPAHTTQWMKARNLDSRLVEDILLTHCHADHDSGTLQKIMEEGRVRLHTTNTVMESFVRKYRSLLGLDSEELEKLFDFQPLLMGPKLSILGARFRFWYTLHPIPTLGFEAEHKGKSFAYSCDTLYDPEVFDQLHGLGILSKERRQTLRDFPWDADMIFHEAGIPPIHTPIKVLTGQPEEVRDRMYLTHVSADIIGEEKSIKVAPTGLGNTLVLHEEQPLSREEQPLKMLDILLHAEIFADCPLEKSLEFLHIVRTENVEMGDEIIREGEWGDRFYLVSQGEAGVFKNNELIRTLRRYDYFGEMAIVLDTTRHASVRALTDCELVVIDRSDFIKFIANTELPGLLHRVAQNKLNDLWPVMKANRSLNPLSPFQRGQLLSILAPRDFKAGDVLFTAGGLPLEIYLVATGAVRLISNQGGEFIAERGALFGRFPEKDRLVTHEVSAVAARDGQLFVGTLTKLRSFFRRNPGTFVRISRILRQDSFSVST